MIYFWCNGQVQGMNNSLCIDAIHEHEANVFKLPGRNFLFYDRITDDIEDKAKQIFNIQCSDIEASRDMWI